MESHIAAKFGVHRQHAGRDMIFSLTRDIPKPPD